MGLIICPECGKQFSDKAKACPHCGCPLEVILNELSNIDSNIIDDEGKEDFRGFIKDHVIDAYVNEITIVKPFLYKNEYSDAKVHPFRKFRAPFSGKAEHTFPE